MVHKTLLDMTVTEEADFLYSAVSGKALHCGDRKSIFYFTRKMITD